MAFRRVAALLAAATLVCLCGPAAPAGATVPAGFVGVVADGPLLEPGADLGRELDLMKASGVQSVRVTFAWSAAQPYASFADAPPGQDLSRFSDVDGRPTDFTASDRLVKATARRGLRLLPVVLYSPPWDRSDAESEAAPPRDPRPFARFAGALAERYGSGGAFWRENPSVRRQPVRAWQIWNEPNIRHYWPQPFARGYVKMLRATRSRLRAADPHARLILGGLTNDSWNALVRIYRAGGKRYFDAVAIHPYTRRVRGLVKILAYVRYGMKRFHDERKPIVVSELSWPSAAGKVRDHGFNEVTEAQQAKRVRASLALLARYRRHFRIEAAYWYTWMSADSGPYYFSYAGLRKMTRGRATSKPALSAFRRVARHIER
jgi:hypothetical protein